MYNGHEISVSVYGIIVLETHFSTQLLSGLTMLEVDQSDSLLLAEIFLFFYKYKVQF